MIKHKKQEQIRKDLLQIIGCPKCKGELTLAGQKLNCHQCQIEYPIEKGIPVLLSPQLRVFLEIGQASVKSYYLGERYDWTEDPKGLEFLYHRYRRWETWREITKLLRPGSVVLDVGCGTGLITQIFAQHRYKVIAIDLNQWALSRINGKPYVTKVQGDAESLPIQDETVDFMIATEVIEHLEDSDSTARELFRVCTKGGRVVGSVPSTSRVWNMRSHLSLTCMGDEPFHLSFTKSGITTMWQKAGFKVSVKRSCLGLNWLWMLEKP